MDEEQTLRAEIILNGEEIVLPTPWTTVDFIDNVRTKFNDQLTIDIQHADFTVFECPSPGPLNEALDTVVEMSN